MNREGKMNEDLEQLEDRKNYQPLDQQMVKDTSKKVENLITSLYNAGCIDEITILKWFDQTVFWTLTKTHKPVLVGGPIISGCDGPTEHVSSLTDRLLQPIAQYRTRILKIEHTSLN